MARKGFGVEVSFKGDSTTLEQLFGSKPIMSTQLSKKIWQHIRAKEFEAQKDWKPTVGSAVRYYWKKDTKWYSGTLVKIVGKTYSVEEKEGTFKVKRNELMKKA